MDGDTVWTKKYSKMGGNVGATIIEDSDLNYLIAGSTFIIGNNTSRDIFITNISHFKFTNSS